MSHRAAAAAVLVQGWEALYSVWEGPRSWLQSTGALLVSTNAQNVYGATIDVRALE